VVLLQDAVPSRVFPRLLREILALHTPTHPPPGIASFQQRLAGVGACSMQRLLISGRGQGRDQMQMVRQTDRQTDRQKQQQMALWVL
jgi:hypothetical protein